MQFITAVHSMCGILAVEPNVIINKCLNQSDVLGHSTAYFKNCLFYSVKTIVNLSVPYVVSKAASVYIKKTTEDDSLLPNVLQLSTNYNITLAKTAAVPLLTNN